MPDETRFILLAIDEQGKVRTKDPLSLLHAIRGFSSLWDRPQVDDQRQCIREEGCKLVVAEAGLV